MQKASKKTSGQVSKKQAASLQNNFLLMLSVPAKRALENNGINSVKKLSQLSEKTVLSFHGIGPSSIPKLKEVLQAEGLSFKK
jgi:DNA-directed RNA polymerase alpha subunit